MTDTTPNGIGVERERVALDWLDKRTIGARDWLAKCGREVEAFDAMRNCEAFAQTWREAEAAAVTRLEIFEDLAAVVADRDEWRTQHENLLSVRQSDLAALSQSQEPAKPDGMVLVPRDPTEAMVMAGRRFLDSDQYALARSGVLTTQLFWSAMIAAATAGKGDGEG